MAAAAGGANASRMPTLTELANVPPWTFAISEPVATFAVGVVSLVALPIAISVPSALVAVANTFQLPGLSVLVMVGSSS